MLPIMHQSTTLETKAVQPPAGSVKRWAELYFQNRDKQQKPAIYGFASSSGQNWLLELVRFLCIKSTFTVLVVE